MIILEDNNPRTIDYSSLTMDDISIPESNHYTRRSSYINEVNIFGDRFDKNFKRLESTQYSFSYSKGRCWSCGVDLFKKTTDGEYIRDDTGKLILSGFHNDHLIAISRGGATTVGNLAHACEECNLRKSNKNLWRFIEDNLKNSIHSPHYKTMEEAKVFFKEYFSPWREKFPEYFTMIYNYEECNQDLYNESNFDDILLMAATYRYNNATFSTHKPSNGAARSYRDMAQDYGAMYPYFSIILDKSDTQPISKGTLNYCSTFFKTAHEKYPCVTWENLKQSEQNEIIKSFLEEKTKNTQTKRDNFSAFRRACFEIYQISNRDFNLLRFFFEKDGEGKNIHTMDYLLDMFDVTLTEEERRENSIDDDSIEDDMEEEIDLKELIPQLKPEVSLPRDFPMGISEIEEDENETQENTSGKNLEEINYQGDGDNAPYYRRILKANNESDFDNEVKKLFNHKTSDYNGKSIDGETMRSRWKHCRNVIRREIKNSPQRQQWFEKWDSGFSAVYNNLHKTQKTNLFSSSSKTQNG